METTNHAHWAISPDGYYPYCSHCHTEPENGVMSKYCPECGYKMDEGSADHLKSEKNNYLKGEQLL